MINIPKVPFTDRAAAMRGKVIDSIIAQKRQVAPAQPMPTSSELKSVD